MPLPYLPLLIRMHLRYATFCSGSCAEEKMPIGRLDALNNRRDLPKPKVISLMTKETAVAVIALGIFALVVSCCAIDIPAIGNNATALNNTSPEQNATNSTLNGSVDSIINQSNKSDLWNWGDVPAGYVRKNGKIVPEAYLDSDESIMETPNQLSPNNVDKDARTGGLLVQPK